MKLSAILAPLIAAGVSGEVILATVKAFEEQQSDAIERRRESDRVRQQRRRHVMSRDVTVTERDKDTSSPCPLDPPSQTLPPIIPQSSSPETSLRSENKRGTRLPSDWALPVAWGRWALGEGFSEATIRLEADKFRDFWCSKSGKDATKLDWEATWRNWMRNCSKHPSSRAPPRQERTMDEVIDDFIERHSHEPTAGTTIDHDVGDHPANVHRLAAPKRRGF